MGVVISSFSFAGLFAAPLFGKWTDKLQKCRIPFMTGVLFSIAGAVIYFCVRDKEGYY